MNLFDVYPLYDIEPVKAQGSTLWDTNGQKYTDLYGGHAVISIGHTHPRYVQRLSDQLNKIGFYSNSVQISAQKELAERLGRVSGLTEYDLFLVNSGAEANENALKLASFHTGRTRVVACTKAFHGRTSAAVAVTDNPSIKAPLNFDQHVTFVPFNDVEAVKTAITEETAAVIVEGIQGVGGIHVATEEFYQAIRTRCDETGTVFIHDSVQCGYGRSGAFFTFQHGQVLPDLITTAKGMGNGFPVGGVLISPKFKAKHGLLGTTFGGNHLACTAANAVLEVMEEEQLISRAGHLGTQWMKALSEIPGIAEVRGQGLMIGLELEKPVGPVREALLRQHFFFTGVAGGHTIRLLPALNVAESDMHRFVEALRSLLVG